jgi:dTMP kinase
VLKAAFAASSTFRLSFLGFFCFGTALVVIQHGKFITFEGGEGSGKSTQIERLAYRLRSFGVSVVVTREPGGSPFAEKLRDIILATETPEHSALSEAMVFSAARADHLDQLIRPALQDGKWVLCDRFADSTRAYQGYAGALSLEVIQTLEDIVVADTQPDMTIVMDVDVDIGLARAGNRHLERGLAPQDRDRFESRSETFHVRLRRAFLDIAKNNPHRCVVVDGGRDPDAVAEDIWQTVHNRVMAAWAEL